jgi:uncharacterized membrane protein
LICGTLRRFVSTPNPDALRRDLAFREGTAGFSLTLKRNCSISPAGLLRVFAALGFVALAIGAGFAVAGAWLVLPFAGLEVLLLGIAFVLHSRHATDYEKIELASGRLTVEVAEAERKALHELDARRVHVYVEGGDGYGARVFLRGAEKELELGRHLDAVHRVVFAAELEKRLRI